MNAIPWLFVAAVSIFAVWLWVEAEKVGAACEKAGGIYFYEEQACVEKGSIIDLEKQ